MVWIVLRRRSRCPAEQKLMCRKTGPLVGLEHFISPSVLGGELQVRVQNIIGVCHKSELWLAWTGSAAMDAGRTIHLARGEPRSARRIAHCSESRVGVT